VVVSDMRRNACLVCILIALHLDRRPLEVLPLRLRRLLPFLSLRPSCQTARSGARSVGRSL
jgi:hypothetical protein